MRPFLAPLDVKRWFRDALRSIADYLFGYDFFISYSHADGDRYPRRLRERLRELSFEVFLDREVYVAGEDLKLATRRRVRMSRKTVVLLGPAALRSRWVLREVETCLDAGRDVIAIDFGGSLADAEPSNELAKRLEDRLRLHEPAPDLAGEPSSSIPTDLQASFKAVRQETLRLRAVAAVSIVLAILTGFATWQWRSAANRADEMRSGYLLGLAHSVQSARLRPLLAAEVAREPPGGVQTALDLARRAHPIIVRELGGRPLWGAISPSGDSMIWGLDGGAVLKLRTDGRGDAEVLREAVRSGRPASRVSLEDYTRMIDLGRLEAVIQNDLFDPSGERFLLLGRSRVEIVGRGEASSPLIIEPSETQIRDARFVLDGALLLIEGEDGSVRLFRSDTAAPEVKFEPEEGCRIVGEKFLTEEDRTLGVIVEDCPFQVSSSGERRNEGRSTKYSFFEIDSGRSTLLEDPTYSESCEDQVLDRVEFGDGEELTMLLIPRFEKFVCLDVDATLRVLQHGDTVTSARFSADGQWVVTTTEVQDGAVRIWSLDEKEDPLIIPPAEDFAWTALLGPDRHHLVTVQRDGTAVILGPGFGPPRTVKRQVTFEWHGLGPPPLLPRPVSEFSSFVLGDREEQVVAVSYSPSGSLLVLATLDGRVSIWPARGDALPRVFAPYDYFEAFNSFGRLMPTGPEFSPDGDRFLTVSSEEIRLSAIDGAQEDIVLGRQMGGLQEARFDPKGERVFVRDDEGTIRLFSASGSELQLAELPAGVKVGAVAFTACGSPRVAGVDDQGRLGIWTFSGTWRHALFAEPGRRYESMHFDPRGERLATVSNPEEVGDGSRAGPGDLHIWLSDGSLPPLLIPAPVLEARDVVFGLNQTYVATLHHFEGMTRIWRVSGGALIKINELPGYERELFAAALSPDGELIATGTGDGFIRIWRTEVEDEEPLVIPAHETWVVGLAFSRQGGHLVSTSMDYTSRVWPVSWPTLRRHFATATALCLEPEERVAYLGESRRTAQRQFKACERRFDRND